MNYLIKYLLDPIFKVGETLVSISPFIMFIMFVALTLWANKQGKKRSDCVNVGLKNIETAFDAAIKEMNKEIKGFERLMIKYQIINEKILVEDFDTIKEMITLNTNMMIDKLAYLICEHRKIHKVDPFDAADIIADEAQDSSATRRNDLKRAKISSTVVDIYEEAEADIHNSINGFILTFVNKANIYLDKTDDFEIIKPLAEDTKNKIVNHFLKALHLRLSLKE